MVKLLPIVKELEDYDNSKRLSKLKKALRKNKISFKVEKYNSGENIVIGKGDILFTAHHDAFSNSPGANDNASAMAVLMGLAKARKAAIAIFGEEEIGCIGAKAYIKKHGLPKAVVDLEMMGKGDIMAIWPVDYQRPLLEKIRKGIRKAGIYFEEARKVPTFWADFTAFRNAGLLDAWCLTLVPSSEKKLIRRFATNPVWATILFFIGGIPEFFKHYHSHNDNSAALTEESLQLSLKAVISVYDELHK